MAGFTAAERERERERFPEPGRRFIIVDTRVRLFGGGWWPRAGFDVTTDSRDAAESLVPLLLAGSRTYSSDKNVCREKMAGGITP